MPRQQSCLKLLWCWLAVCVVVAACADHAPESAAGEAAAPAGDIGSVETSVPVPQRGAAANRPAGRQRVDGAGPGGQQTRLRVSSSAGPPFGRADLYGGPDPVRDGLWISVGPNDDLGPLHQVPDNPRAAVAGRVYDVCVLEEAWIISYGYRPLDGVPAGFVGPWRRDNPGCSTVDDPDHEPFARWSFVGELRSSPYFRTKGEAFAWGREFEDQMRQLISGPLPLNAQLLGTVEESLYEPIEFAGVLDSAERVRVIPESLAYDAGTLRGLVRNWSPTQFAYEVSVSINGVSWRWPLSIQPGELAPFELAGLALDVSPTAGELEVEARLREDADLSRAFDFSCSPPWFEGNAKDLSGLVPDVVYEALPQQGRHAMGYYCAYLNRFVASRPDWEHDEQPIEIDDMRSYVAFIDHSGSVIELRELTLFTEYYVDGQDGKITPETITSIPDESVFDGKSYRSSTVHVAFAVPDIGEADDEWLRSAGWVAWIGGAHPQPAR